MVVCKFFLQGNCKFGDYCKFDHQLGDNFNTIQNPNSVSILRQPNFGPSQPTKPANPTNVDTNTLVKSVVNDMTVSEKGGQWLLSCYAPFKEKPGFPGFEDQSFEEIRLGHYEAVRSGTLEQYKQQIQIMLQQAVLKLKSLQAPSPDIINMLKSIYNTPPSSHAGVFGNNSVTTSSAFINPTVSSLLSQPQLPGAGPQTGPAIFAQANQALLGNSVQAQNKFAGTPNIFGNAAPNANIFGGQTTNSLFNNSQPQNSSKGIFNQANTNFGNQTGNSIFGAHQPGMQPSTGSVFASEPPNSNSIFGGAQVVAPFTTQPQVQTNSGNIFIKQANPPFDASNAFGTQNISSPFSQAGPNIFATPLSAQVNQPFGSSGVQPSVDKQVQNQIYGTVTGQQSGVTTFPQQSQYQNSNSPFAQQTQITSTVQSHSSNIFGNNQPTKGLNLPLGQSQQIDESIYSKLEDLTEDEIKWFESDDLDILNIPEKPPTYEMCFKR